jgi:hypothetical protein
MNLTIWLFGEFKPRHCGRGLHVSGLRVPGTIAGAHPSAPPFPVWAGTCPSVVHRRPTAVSGPSSMCGAAPIPTPYPVFHPRCATLKGAEPPQLKPPLPLQPPHSELPPPTTVVLRHRPLLTPRPTLVLQFPPKLVAGHRSPLATVNHRRTDQTPHSLSTHHYGELSTATPCPRGCPSSPWCSPHGVWASPPPASATAPRAWTPRGDHGRCTCCAAFGGQATRVVAGPRAQAHSALWPTAWAGPPHR